MNTKNIAISAVIVIALLVGGFFFINDYIYQEKQAEVPAVEGMSFVLSSFNGEEVEMNERYTLSFEDGSVFARMCNSMGGSYEVAGGQMTALVASTLMYCSEPEWLMDAEGALQQLFSRGVTLSLSSEGVLTLSDAEHTFVFTSVQ